MISRRIIWAEQVARMVERRMHTKFWSENLKERGCSEELVRDGEIQIRIDLTGIG
jgi:hypothetical protein